MDLETRLARLKESVDRGFINKAEYENCVRIAKLELTPEARAADTDKVEVEPNNVL